MVQTLWTVFTAESIQHLKNKVSAAYSIHHLSRTKEKITLYDTYDRRLLRDNRVLIQFRDKVAYLDISRYILDSKKYECPFKGELPRFWQDYPEGALQNEIRSRFGFYGIDSLLKLSMNSDIEEIKNSDNKIVCYVDLNTIEDITFISIRYLKGYENDYKKIIEIITSQNIQTADSKLYLNFLKHHNVRMYYETPLSELVSSGNVPTRKAVSDIILGFLHTARYYEPGIIDDFDTECLHNYRISIRKIRSLLSIVRGIYPPADLVFIKSELKYFQQQTNHLRDLDVLCLERNDYQALLPARYIHATDSLFDRYLIQRHEEYKRVSVYLKSSEYESRIISLERYFQESFKQPATETGSQPVSHTVRFFLDKLNKKLSKEIAALKPGSPDEAYHELRISFKKLRYILELFSPLFTQRLLKKILRYLKISQTALGTFNDLSIQQNHLMERVKENEETIRSLDTALGLGILIGVLNQKQLVQKDNAYSQIQSFVCIPVKTATHSVFKLPPWWPFNQPVTVY